MFNAPRSGDPAPPECRVRHVRQLATRPVRPQDGELPPKGRSMTDATLHADGDPVAPLAPRGRPAWAIVELPWTGAPTTACARRSHRGGYGHRETSPHLSIELDSSICFTGITRSAGSSAKRSSRTLGGTPDGSKHCPSGVPPLIQGHFAVVTLQSVDWREAPTKEVNPHAHRHRVSTRQPPTTRPTRV